MSLMSSMGLKGLSVITSGQEKSSNPSEIKNSTGQAQAQHAPFFLKSQIDLAEKWLFIRFHFVGPDQCFSQ